MPTYIFWFFSLVMLLGGGAVVVMRNPVASALSVVASFIGLAGLFIGLSAFFVGVVQVLVYTGAVMVLFMFIIMLLDLKTGVKRVTPIAQLIGGVCLIIAFTVQFLAVHARSVDVTAPSLDKSALVESATSLVDSGAIPASGKIAVSLNAGSLPDVHLIGHHLFTRFNLPLQILGVILLVATVGVVALSKKSKEEKSR